MVEKKTCLDCGELLMGRIDKKFCSDQCRNNYNNRLNSDTNNQVRLINNILRKNRRILEELNPNGKLTVHKDKLSTMGFNFMYHTHIYTSKNGNTYFFCYEQGYLALEKSFFMLVRREESHAKEFSAKDEKTQNV